MAILTNEQFIGVGVLGAVALWYVSRKIGAVAEQAIDSGVKAVGEAATATGGAVNAPLRLFNDPEWDGSTFGTEAWFQGKVDDITGIFSGPVAQDPAGSPYSDNKEFTQVPDL
ncbi:hypothetical protein [uncultured Amphritea sp.]|uniref:hypothetical protein n=1 Tax=uncultured Amphritea sp. TaxID=981605 RepID=UPI00261D8967|nr:hypothetical protein [uncultured Amphritea sp.]